MKYAIKYTEFISHTEGEIRLSDTREEHAKRMVEHYKKQFNVKENKNAFEYFLRDAGAYHAVRNILEDIKTDDFSEVVEEFKKLYPGASQEWKSALKCGLVVKAGSKVGNYSNGEYIFNCPLSQQIREATINGPIDKIIQFADLRKATGCENKNTLIGLVNKSIEAINRQTNLEF